MRSAVALSGASVGPGQVLQEFLGFSSCRLCPAPVPFLVRQELSLSPGRQGPLPLAQAPASPCADWGPSRFREEARDHYVHVFSEVCFTPTCSLGALCLRVSPQAQGQQWGPGLQYSHLDVPPAQPASAVTALSGGLTSHTADLCQPRVLRGLGAHPQFSAAHSRAPGPQLPDGAQAEAPGSFWSQPGPEAKSEFLPVFVLPLWRLTCQNRGRKTIEFHPSTPPSILQRGVGREGTSWQSPPTPTPALAWGPLWPTLPSSQEEGLGQGTAGPQGGMPGTRQGSPGPRGPPTPGTLPLRLGTCPGQPKLLWTPLKSTLPGAGQDPENRGLSLARGPLSTGPLVGCWAWARWPLLGRVHRAATGPVCSKLSQPPPTPGLGWDGGFASRVVLPKQRPL
ncbi:uncharacterized protein LOC119514901 [Choloepus didactylus]|uniref:uncharacterized protein LOC119514901 n=1 Tax=Choloepus didactylus TaxID=27675 RepID=UPI00189DCD6E|nr:uncharacterized protein LOC119514901 [Choloepus didactylus]